MSTKKDRLPSGRTNLAQAGAQLTSPPAESSRQPSARQSHIDFSPIAARQVYNEERAPATATNTHRGLFAPNNAAISALDSGRSQMTTGTNGGYSSSTKKRAATHRNLRELLATRRQIHQDPISLTNEPNKLGRVARELEMNDFDEGKVYDILTHRSVAVAKEAVARQFFGTLDSRKQMKDMRVQMLEGRTLSGRVDVMVNSDFTSSLRALKYRQRVIEGKGSRQMQGCMIYKSPAEVGDPQFLAKQDQQYKPYAAGYEQNSQARTFNELRMRRRREEVDAGAVWRDKTKGVPEGVSYKRVSAFKLDAGD